MAFFVGFGVHFLVNCWSRSFVSNYKIETKNDAGLKCDFDVTTGFPNFENFGAEWSMILENLSGSDWSRS